MKDEDKSQEQLVRELAELRQRLADLEAMETERRRAEAARQESEQRYRQIVEEASDALYTTDPQGHFIYVNPPGQKLTGYAEDELIGMHFTHLIPTAWHAQVRSFYQQQIRAWVGETIFEFPVVTRSGEEKWVEQTTTLLIDGDRLIGFQSIVRDVTRRRQAQRESQKARDELEVKVAERTAQLTEANARLQQYAQRLNVLRELDRAISTSLRLSDVFHAFAHHAGRLLPYDRMSIALLEGEEIRVSYVASQDEAPSAPAVGVRLPRQGSGAGWVMERGHPLLRHDLASQMRFIEDEQLLAGEVRSAMIIPLRVKGTVIGTWNLGQREVGAYSPDDLEVIQSMADQLAIAIENARLYGRARQEIRKRRRAEEALKESEQAYRSLVDNALVGVYKSKIWPAPSFSPMRLWPGCSSLSRLTKCGRAGCCPSTKTPAIGRS